MDAAQIKKLLNQSEALHSMALRLAAIPGCEKSVNVVSLEALRIDKQLKSTECPTCLGYGVIPNHIRKYVRKCPSCKGSGYTVDNEEVAKAAGRI